MELSLGLTAIDPDADGVLAAGARLSEQRETLLKRNAEQVDVDKIRVAFSEHPGIVCEDHPWNQIDEVVASKWNHEEDLHDASYEGEAGQLGPACCAVF